MYNMGDRILDRLTLLTSDELDRRLRSVSPHTAGSRRASRSPRPSGAEQRAAAAAQEHCSHPTISAWPAPPPKPDLVSTHQKLQLVTLTPPNDCQGPEGPLSDHSLLSILSASGSPSPGGAPRYRESELKRKIQSLEDTVAEYERQKYNVMGTFSEYKERVADRERRLEADYSSKILALSEEVLGAKKDFETRMKSFQALQDKFEREKESALDKLRQEHQKEIQVLEQRFSESQLLNLEQKYIVEIRRLEEERKSLRSEKERLGETFEMKLRRAQSLYDTELAAAKMLYTRELEALRDHEAALKAELAARQDEFNDRLNELQNEARGSRDGLRMWKNEVNSLQRKLREKEAELQTVRHELEVARGEMSDALVVCNSLNTEAEDRKKNSEIMQEELSRKCDLLASVENANSELESVMSDLKKELKAMKNKVEFLEKERSNLQSQSESLSHVHESQVQALQAVLESVTKEKESAKANYERVLAKEKQQAELREHAMKKEFSIKLNELEEQYNALKEDLEHSAQADKDELRQCTEREMECLRIEKRILEARVQSLEKQKAEEGGDSDQADDAVKQAIEEMNAHLEEYRTRIASKNAEIEELKKHVHEENQLSADQLSAIKDEIRHELLSSEEFSEDHSERQKLHNKVAELEDLVEKKLQDELETQLRMSELSDENERLTKTLLAVGRKERDAVPDMLTFGTQTDFVDEDEEDNLLDQLTKERKENEEKSVQLEELRDKISVLIKEANKMKGELKTKTEELATFAESNDPNPERTLCNKIEHLAEERDTLKEENEQQNERISELEQELEKERERERRRIARESSECQTDELASPPTVAIIDLAREKELKMKIAELEAALQQKEDMICEIQGQTQCSSSDSSEEREKESSPTALRAKSPLSRMRDRSPAAKSLGSSRNQLCPPEGERRSSPMRCLQKNKRDEKKPAWKF